MKKRRFLKESPLFFHTTELPPRILPTSRKSWEGKGGGLEGGRGTFLKKGPPSPLQFFRYVTSFRNHEIGCMDGSFV